MTILGRVKDEDLDDWESPFVFPESLQVMQYGVGCDRLFYDVR